MKGRTVRTSVIGRVIHIVVFKVPLTTLCGIRQNSRSQSEFYWSAMPNCKECIAEFEIGQCTFDKSQRDSLGLKEGKLAYLSDCRERGHSLEPRAIDDDPIQGYAQYCNKQGCSYYNPLPYKWEPGNEVAVKIAEVTCGLCYAGIPGNGWYPSCSVCKRGCCYNCGQPDTVPYDRHPDYFCNDCLPLIQPALDKMRKRHQQAEERLKIKIKSLNLQVVMEREDEPIHSI